MLGREITNADGQHFRKASGDADLAQQQLVVLSNRSTRLMTRGSLVLLPSRSSSRWRGGSDNPRCCFFLFLSLSDLDVVVSVGNYLLQAEDEEEVLIFLH